MATPRFDSGADLSLLQVATPTLRPPFQPLLHLDALWLQVAGTTCNLACTHCFVSCGPGNTHHEFMTRREVADRVREGLALGVRELYLTGGEPFLHPELLEILADSLGFAPCTVLTNGTLFTSARLAGLRRLTDSSRFSLELRVSLDGDRAEIHDAIRGPGSFARTMEGLRDASRVGLLPIVTAVDREDDADFRRRLTDALRAAGIERPRTKLLPRFLHGRESRRTRPYQPSETLAGVPEAAIEAGRLQCGSCRAVTSRGVYPCPLVVEEPGGRIADSLDRSLGPVALSYGACYTCFVTGMSCGNS